MDNSSLDSSFLITVSQEDLEELVPGFPVYRLHDVVSLVNELIEEDYLAQAIKEACKILEPNED